MSQKTAAQLKEQLGAVDLLEWQRDVADSAWMRGEKASQAQAEAGVADDVLMTPLKTAQAIAALQLFGNAKIYLVTLSQTSTGAPSVTNEFRNTLGGTPTPARAGAGSYTLTLTGAFPSGKTLVFIGSIGAGVSGGAMYHADAKRQNNNAIQIFTYDATGLSNLDDLLSSTPLLILVYP